MKIAKIQIKNFRGKDFELKPDKINVCFHENGYGKSTLCDAIRYGLTGLVPEDNIRNMAVKICYESGLETERQRTRLSIFKVNNAKTTETEMNKAIFDEVGISVPDMKIISSSELFMRLKPDELLNFLIQYIPEQLDLETVLGYFKKRSPEIDIECSFVFPVMPEKFGIKELSKAYQYFYNGRRILSADVRKLEAQYQNLEANIPPQSRSLDEVLTDIFELSVREAAQKDSAVKIAEYNADVEKKKRQDLAIQDLETKISKLNVRQEPKKEELLRIETMQADINDKLIDYNRRLATTEQNMNLFENMLNELNTQRCPISDKLICTTDKTAVRHDLTAAVTNNREILIKTKKDIADADAEKQELIARKEEFMKQKQSYELFCRYQSELEAYRINQIVLSEPKPELLEDYDTFASKREQLEQERVNIEAHMKKDDLLRQINSKKQKIECYQYIVNALDDKGEVKHSIISYYLGMFEKVCNERSTSFSADFTFRFLPENGVKVMVKTAANSEFLPLQALSKGENILALIILLDMINQLSGTGLLLLDNVEALDQNNLKKISKLIRMPQFSEMYDHIFICGVNHKDVTDAFQDMQGKAF